MIIVLIKLTSCPFVLRCVVMKIITVLWSNQTRHTVTAPPPQLSVTVVCVSLVTVWKERTPWLHWRGSMEDLRETLF